MAVVVLLWQYRTRRTKAGWVLWVLTLAWVAVVRLFWVWDLRGIAGRGHANAAERQHQRARATASRENGTISLRALRCMR